MTLNELAFDAERIQVKMWELSGTVLAVSDAITDGPNDATAYHGALHALNIMVIDAEEQIDSFVKNLLTLNSEYKMKENAGNPAKGLRS